MGYAGSVWFGHSTVACPNATCEQQQGGHWQRHPISEVVVTPWRSIIFTQRLFETPSRCTMCHAAEKSVLARDNSKSVKGFWLVEGHTGTRASPIGARVQRPRPRRHRKGVAQA